jgi:hypothetical protein
MTIEKDETTILIGIIAGPIIGGSAAAFLAFFRKRRRTGALDPYLPRWMVFVKDFGSVKDFTKIELKRVAVTFTTENGTTKQGRIMKIRPSPTHVSGKSFEIQFDGEEGVTQEFLVIFGGAELEIRRARISFRPNQFRVYVPPPVRRPSLSPPGRKQGTKTTAPVNGQPAVEMNSIPSGGK